ncbi:MAG TPA: cytochrome b [Rhizomicrobium sp.]|nr:cytochrome b [Rhizomicrobium sp.]
MADARNTTLRYGTVAMALHWLIALGVIANICLGLYFADMPNSDPAKFGLAQTHKSIGLTVLVLSLLRAAWRLMNPVPPLPRGMSRALRRLARASHVLLYILIVLIPLTGWLMVSASPLGIPTHYFGLFNWPDIPFFTDMTLAQKHVVRDNFGAAHVILAWSAIVLVPIHIAGALYHQFLRGDDVLRRMLPGTNVTDPA